MCPRIRLIVAAAVALILCRAAADQGNATVIRDSKAGPSNPAVDAGGYSLPSTNTDNRPPAAFPYSLIGALRTEDAWFSYLDWPWRLFRSFNWHPHGVGGNTIGTPPGDRPINRPPRPAR